MKIQFMGMIRTEFMLTKLILSNEYLSKKNWFLSALRGQCPWLSLMVTPSG